jgi:hypothetical protein
MNLRPRSRLRPLLLAATVAAFLLVSAAQASAAETLTVDLAGGGIGTVTSEPPGISCSNTGGSQAGSCSAEFDSGFVELTATGDPGSQFVKWSASAELVFSTCDSGSANPCRFLSIGEVEHTITATFAHLPVIEVEPVEPGEVTPHTAVLSGRVDPDGNGEVSACDFDFVSQSSFEATGFSDLSSGGTAPCEPPAPIGAATAVHAGIDGLTPRTTYRFRLRAENANGKVEEVGPEFTSPPGTTVATGAAADAGRSSARVGGEVTPFGSPIQECVFEYGAGEAVDRSAPCEEPAAGEIGSGDEPMSVHAVLVGLSPNTFYSFRLKATNGEGDSAVGEGSGFSTLPPPPSLSVAGPAAIAPRTATLAGTVSPGSAGPNSDTTYRFQYGTTLLYGRETAVADAGMGTAAVPVFAPITDLAPNTLYHYRLVASNANEDLVADPALAPQLVDGPDASFSTLAPLPTLGAAAPAGATAFILSGSVEPSGSDLRYLFEYGTTVAYGQTSDEEDAGSGSGAVAVSTEVGALTPGVTYHYRLLAVGEGGPVASPDGSFTVYAPAPSVSTGGASDLAVTTATLGGSLDGHGAPSTYRFQYGTTDEYGSASTVTAGGGDVSALVTDLLPSTTYHYRLLATSAGGNVGGEDRTFTTAPMAPALLPQPKSGCKESQVKKHGRCVKKPKHHKKKRHHHRHTESDRGSAR